MSNNTRLNRCLLCVGRKGTGKTTIALKLAEKSTKKIIIIDTDDHPTYADVPIVSFEELKSFSGSICRVITGEPDAVFNILNNYQANAFVICEDAAKYINANISKAAKVFIIDHRKRNFDVVLMFHFLGDVPPYLCKQYDYLVLFKTGDSLRMAQHKFANWHTIVKKLERIMKHKSFNHCETIAIDE